MANNLQIRGGVFPALMTTLKKAAEGSDGKKDSISGAELKPALKRVLAGIKDNYDGADSEKGLANLRNALVKTFKAADKNWTISSTGYKVAGEILTYCVEAGGSITGEHGVGADKKHYMPRMFSDDDLDAFQQLRDALDPQRLCNPGKVLPTPRLCGEVPGPYREHPAERAGLAERF